MDGRRKGQTPSTFEAEPGKTYRVSYLLEGHNPTSFTIQGPASDTLETVSRSLQRKVVAMGKVNVNLRTGWATVYIDGKKVTETPLFNHELATGSHTIRVVNEARGLDESREVMVKASETVNVAF